MPTTTPPAADMQATPLMFTVVVELDVPTPVDATITTITEAIAPFSGCLSSCPTNHGTTSLVTISVPGLDLRQAVATALAVTAPLGPAVGVEALREDLSDTRAGFTPMPALVSVSQAAEILDVSRVTVHNLFQAGALAGEKVGGTLVLTEASVRTQAEQRAAKTGKVSKVS